MNENRPTGWAANPQAMALVSRRREYTGHPELSVVQDADTWLTPRYILDRLGRFDLDPCACESAKGWVCDRAFTKSDDGLTNEWAGRVFMNPPFSNTTPWLVKHAAHAHGISLVPASVESQVWRRVVWNQAIGMLLLHGRTRFANPDGSITVGRPLRSVALIAWTETDFGLLERSGIAGVLIQTWKQV